jgi:uncharacterized protein YbaR (Trm112 family)
MKTDILHLICDPSTKEPLEQFRDKYYFNPKSGQKFPIMNNIPNFLSAGDITGDNKTYERMYRWIAFAYDFMELTVAPIFIGDSLLSMRRELMNMLEKKEGNSALIVSIGTGMDLKFLPKHAEYYGLDITSSMLNRCQKYNFKGGMTPRSWSEMRKKFLSVTNVLTWFFITGGSIFSMIRKRP